MSNMRNERFYATEKMYKPSTLNTPDCSRKPASMMVDIGGGGHVSHLRTRIRVEAARRRALAPTRPNGCGMEREETGPHFGIRRFPRGRQSLDVP
jgi:hypothetical protein